MATHTINKKLLVGVLAISGAFALASCADVKAVPTTYNNNILFDKDGNAIPTNENIMGALYEAISSGKESKVLDVIMEELVNEKYGVKAKNAQNEVIGYSVYTKIKSLYEADVKADIVSYCKDHSEVFVRENDDADGDMQYKRFKHFYEDIDKRICKELLSLVKQSQYEDEDGMFDEQLLVDDLTKDWDSNFQDGNPTNKFFITSELTEENIKDSNHLHMSYYSFDETEEKTRSLADGTECFKEQAKGYIEKKIFPKVLKDKLVEEFILNTEPRALGNASARKINYVKVPFTSDNRDYVESILSDFNKDYIYKASEPTDKNDEKINFDTINYALIGFDHLNPGHFVGSEPLINVDSSDNGNIDINDTFDSANANARLYNERYYYGLSTFDKEFHKTVTVNVLKSGEVKDVFKTVDGKIIFDKDFKVYSDTELGKLLDEYNKAIEAKDHYYTATEEQKSALTRFTPSDSPSMGDTLKKEILTLAKKDITTDGWFVKNGGASELPASLRDRLFRLSVATNLESETTGYVKETFVEGTTNTLGQYRYDSNDKLRGSIPYARNINGRKFIMPSDASDFVENTTTTAAELLFQNDNFVKAEGGSFYMCQVLEAVSYAKIDPKSETCYKVNNAVDYTRIEDTQREIAKVLSTKDTYATNAFTEYLNSYKFRFGDTSMYEYLKGQYPDLDIFDED